MQRPAPGFAKCEPCSGMGFQKLGDFADRTFAKCPHCKGLGQKYLEAASAPKPDAFVC